jgi:hypothetical protein
MDEQKIQPQENDKSAVQLLQEIESGLVNPKFLDRESRYQCIIALKDEGYTNSQIAHVLKCSERNITRDRKEIRKRHSLSPNVEFSTEFAGEIFRNGINHHAYLMRLARSKEATVSERVQAEYAAWRVLRELADKLQSFGYLPTMPRQLELMVDSREDEQSLEDLKAKIFAIETTAKECGNLTPEVAEKIGKLKLRVEKYEVQETTLKLLEEQKSKTQEQEDTNEQKN